MQYFDAGGELYAEAVYTDIPHERARCEYFLRSE